MGSQLTLKLHQRFIGTCNIILSFLHSELVTESSGQCKLVLIVRGGFVDLCRGGSAARCVKKLGLIAIVKSLFKVLARDRCQ